MKKSIVKNIYFEISGKIWLYNKITKLIFRHAYIGRYTGEIKSGLFFKTWQKEKESRNEANEINP